jgi:hypothetical protein
MTFKGFNRNAPLLAGSAGDAGTADGPGHVAVPAAPVAAPVAAAAAPARFAGLGRIARLARLDRIARFRVQPRRRHLLIVAGLGLAVAGDAVAGDHGIGIATLLLFSLLPSLPLLLGIGQPRTAGRVAARAVLPLNIMREPLVPAMALGLGAAGVLPVVAVVGALVWLGTIVIGWGLGDGLREPDGSLRPAPARWTALPVPVEVARAWAGTAAMRG